MFDIKAERYVVDGCCDAGKMQDMLDGFIKQIVLKVEKNMVGASCKACGHIYTMDMRHRLTTFIVKNPPEKDIDSQGSSQTEKKDRKKEKEEEKKGEKKNGGSDENNEGDDWGDDGYDGVWISDTSAEAIAKRAQEQLTSGISGLVIDSDMEKTEEERINIFFKFVQVKRGMINSAVAKEILAEAERLEIKNKAPVVLCELLFNDKMFKEKQINKYAKLLLRFTHENPKGQKYLIGGIEKTVESFEATLLPKVPHIFKELFEEDEETSESDGGVEIEYDERAKISKLKEVETSEPANDVNENQKKKEESEEEDDDVDIDDI